MGSILWKMEPGAAFWLKIEETDGLVVGLYEMQDSPDPVVEVRFQGKSAELLFTEGKPLSQDAGSRMQIALTYANAIARNKHRYEEALKQGGLSQRFPAGTKGTINPFEETAKKLAQLGWESGDAVEIVETLVTYQGNELLLVSGPGDRLYIDAEEFVEQP